MDRILVSADACFLRIQRTLDILDLRRRQSKRKQYLVEGYPLPFNARRYLSSIHRQHKHGELNAASLINTTTSILCCSTTASVPIRYRQYCTTTMNANCWQTFTKIDPAVDDTNKYTFFSHSLSLNCVHDCTMSSALFCQVLDASAGNLQLGKIAAGRLLARSAL